MNRSALPLVWVGRGGCGGDGSRVCGRRSRESLRCKRSRCPGMKLPSGPAGTIGPGIRGLLLGDAVGQADLTDELRARRCSWPPLRLAPGVLRARIRLCRVSRRAPAPLRGKDGLCAGSGWMCIATSARSRWARRAGSAQRGGSSTRVRSLEVMAQSLLPDDVVVVEATTGSDRIVSVLERHEIRVIVANTRKLKAISRGEGQDRPPGCSNLGAAGDGRAAGRGVDAG